MFMEGGSPWGIIHVAQISPCSKVLLDKMVHPIKIHIGKMLTGQVPDGKSLAGRTSGTILPDNRSEQTQKFCIFHDPLKEHDQPFLIDTRIELPYVALEKKQTGPTEVPGTSHQFII